MAPPDLCDLCTLAGGSSHHNGPDQMVSRKTYMRTMKDQWNNVPTMLMLVWCVLHLHDCINVYINIYIYIFLCRSVLRLHMLAIASYVLLLAQSK